MVFGWARKSPAALCLIHRDSRDRIDLRLPAYGSLTLRCVVTLFVTNLQLVRLPVFVHIEVWHFHAQLVQLSIGLADFGNEADAVLIAQIGTHHLIDTGILTWESRKPRGSAGCLGKRSHHIVCL